MRPDSSQDQMTDMEPVGNGTVSSDGERQAPEIKGEMVWEGRLKAGSGCRVRPGRSAHRTDPNVLLASPSAHSTLENPARQLVGAEEPNCFPGHGWENKA